MPAALMVTSSFLPGRGGIESYLAELCDLLAPHVAVLAPARRDGKPLPRHLPYETYPWSRRLMLPRPALVREVIRAAPAGKVIFGTPWPSVLIGPQLKRAGLRYSVIVHGAELLVPAAVPLLRRLLARSLAGAELLLPVSRYTATALETYLRRMGHDVPPLHLLRARVDLERFHPGVPTAAVRRKLGLDVESRTILCLGRLVKRKGVHRLIEVLPRIREKVPGAVVVVAGTGPEERHLRRQAGGRPEVVFAGRVTDEEAAALYRLADVFALPVADRWFGLEIEGLGVVLLEAAACGTPCVTGRSGGTPEAVLDGRTGFVVDARNEALLAERITSLLTDAGPAAEMGRAGREHVLAEFSSQHLPAALTGWIASEA